MSLLTLRYIRIAKCSFKNGGLLHSNVLVLDKKVNLSEVANILNIAVF